jgi:hypothetical protein
MFRTVSIGAVALAAAVATWAQNVPPNISGMAAGILQQSDLARQMVAQHNSDAALDHIRQASTLANEIFQAKPGAPTPLLVRVYQDIDTTTTYAPTKRSRTGEYSADRLKKDTSIRDVDANITTARLDITSAAAHLTAAQNAVERQDWVTADSELGAIPASIIRTNVEGTMPLLEAKQNLELARMRVLENKYKDAEAPLRAAAQNLSDYERMTSAPRAMDAEYYREQIDTFARIVRHRPANAAQQIDAWLTPINTWNSEAAD